MKISDVSSVICTDLILATFNNASIEIGTLISGHLDIEAVGKEPNLACDHPRHDDECCEEQEAAVSANLLQNFVEITNHLFNKKRF